MPPSDTDISAVPALSFFDPDTPSSPDPPSPTPRLPSPAGTCSAAPLVSPSIYSPLLSPDWATPPSLRSPLIIPSSMTQFSSSSSCASDSCRVEDSSSSATASTYPSPAPSPLLSPALEEAYKTYLAAIDSPAIPYSPLLSPRYMFPRTPPCPPTRPSAASSSNPAMPPASTQARRSRNQHKINVTRLRLGDASRHTETVGWGGMDSPVHLYFGQPPQEPRPTIRERRLRAVGSVSSLTSVHGTRKAASKKSGRKSIRMSGLLGLGSMYRAESIAE